MQNFPARDAALRIWRFWGLDAMLVGVLWQQVLSDGLPGVERTVLAVVLGITICGIYALDHLWDQWRKKNSSIESGDARWRREDFCIFQAPSSWVAILFLVISGLLAWWRLPKEVVIYGVALGLLCAGYYGARAYWPGWQSGRDVVLAALFAGGVFGPLLLLGEEIPLTLILAFVALLLANARICLSEEMKKNPRGRGRHWTTVLLILFGCANFLQAVRVDGVPTETVFVGILGAVLLFALVVCRSTRCSLPAQALADAALWLPAAAALGLRA